MALSYLSGGRTLIGVILPSGHQQDIELTRSTSDGPASLVNPDPSTNGSLSDSLVRPCRRGSPTMADWRCDPDDEDEALALRRRDMDNATLARTIQARIPSHSHLVELDVSRNSLTDLPQALVSLTSLRILQVSGNRLGSIPLVLYDMRRITTLDLSDNQIRGVPFHFPPASPQLQVLYLDGNAIESLPSTLSTAWTRMTCLRLGTDNGPASGNRLRRLPDLGSMTGLVELQVAHNLLDCLPAMPPGLVHLQAAHNRLGALDDRVLYPCRRTLESLDLANNLLVELPHGMIHLDRLAMLNVAHNRLERFPADFLELSTPNMVILFTGNPVIHGTGAVDHGRRSSSRPPLINSLRELGLRTALQLDKKARFQDLPEHLLNRLAGGGDDDDDVGLCTVCRGPFLDEHMTSVQVKRYRGHPSVAREVRYCSTRCAQTHAARIGQAIRQKKQQQQQAFAVPMTSRRWPLEWILAAVSAAEEQAANDENDGYLLGL